ncbi:MAG: hypothetical protein COV35_06475 [Alphaproteobacteria bacterium CG11_big_fil_rev_8_21_14_0_20_39_49]|nr:MAG: hypothetical protein COV35_06475 [Alphaproteobacteria bacterium CG11_big_fil_rev_8_21_14_0_20_39_49]
MNVNESHIRQCYGRVVYSHKTHEKCADILTDKLNLVANMQIILSAISAGGIITVLFDSNGMVAKIITALSATMLSAITMYFKQNDIALSIQEHKATAMQLWGVRESYESLLSDIRFEVIDIGEIRSIRDKLQNKLHDVYNSAPRTFYKGYKEAQDSLKNKEDMTFSDEEIDAFLPEHLKSI